MIDGDIIEKVNYVGVIPMILLNGCEGIGTGYSSTIPQYKVEDVIEWVRVWIETGGKVVEDIGDGVILSEGPMLIPYYRNFKGKIEMDGTTATTYGVIDSIGKNKYRVSELPIGDKHLSITKFKEKLDDMLEKKIIKDYYKRNIFLKLIILFPICLACARLPARRVCMKIYKTMADVLSPGSILLRSSGTMSKRTTLCGGLTYDSDAWYVNVPVIVGIKGVQDVILEGPNLLEK